MALNVSTGTPGAASPSAGTHPAHHKYYEKKFCEALQPAELYGMFGDQVAIEANSSNTIVKTKMSELASVEDSPLTEGVTPTEKVLSETRIEKSVDQYGDYMRTTDRLSEEGLNGVTIQFSKRLGQQAGRTLNRIRRNGLLGGTNARFQNAAANANAITAAASSANMVTDYNYMRDAFRLAHVKPLKGLTNGSTNIGTTPTASAYVAIVPVEAVDIIEQMDDGNGNTFKQVETYSGQTTLFHDNEFGRFKNFRFIYDTEVKTSANSAGTPQTIAQCLIFGTGVEDKPYCTVNLAGGNLQTITKPLGSSGSEDPLNQRASMGWKAKLATFIYQDLYMFRHEISLGDA